MPGIISFSFVTFSALFFVVDPFAVIPIFLAITSESSRQERTATALKAAVVTTITLLVFAALGGLIFRIFGITIGAFKIAGGVILFLLSLDMMRAQTSRVRTSPEEENEGLEKEDAAVIPLGIPMLAGPGSIATVTVLMSQAWPSLARTAVVVACILVTGLLTFLLLRAAGMLDRVMGRTGLNILKRLMGLILASVAVQFVVNGIVDVVRIAERG